MKILTVLVFFWPCILICQVSFNQRIINQVDGCHGRYSVDSGDIDGDGFLDIVAALWCHEEDESIVSWFRNNGDASGTFGEERPIEFSGKGTYTVQLIDMDKDGQLDLITAIDNEIILYLNDKGDFSSKEVIYTENNVREIFAEDVDNDGDVDIAFSDNHAGVLFNDGNMNFEKTIILHEQINSAFRVMTADLTGNGFHDFILANASNVIWYQNIDGEFTGTPIHFNDELFTVVSFDVSDYDKDGDMDLVVPGTPLTVFENEGDGLGFKTVKLTEKLSELGLIDAIFLDVDNDGDEDIIAGGNHELVYFENKSNEFRKGEKLFDNLDASPYRFASADFNGDGLLDIVYTTLFGAKVVVHLNDTQPDENVKSNFIYPTLTSSIVNIDSQAVFDKGYILSIQGKLIAKFNFIDQLDLSDYPSGNYVIILLKDDDVIDEAKIVKY